MPSGTLLRQSRSAVFLSALGGVVIVDRQGRVVGEALLLVDRLLHRRGGNSRGRDLVVDPPADVLRPALAAVGPPGVLVRLGVDAAEHIDETQLVEHLGEPGALLGQKARILLVRAPVLEIDLLVCDVPVPAQDDLVASRLQLFKMGEEMLQEAKLRSLAMRSGRARRQVDRDHPELAEARLDVAAFGIELLAGKAAPDLIGLPFAIQRHAAVAFFLGEAVAGGVPFEAVQGRVEIGLLALDLLQADHVRPLRREPAEQALLCRRTDAVDVERDYAKAHFSCWESWRRHGPRTISPARGGTSPLPQSARS